MKQSIQRMCFANVFIMNKVKVFEKNVKYQWVKVMVSMKGPARRNTHLKYESPTTYQSKVMFSKKKKKMVKFQGQRVKVMVSNKRSCQEEYTCEI
jgi:hypothetical protein